MQWLISPSGAGRAIQQPAPNWVRSSLGSSSTPFSLKTLNKCRKLILKFDKPVTCLLHYVSQGIWGITSPPQCFKQPPQRGQLWGHFGNALQTCLGKDSSCEHASAALEWLYFYLVFCQVAQVVCLLMHCLHSLCFMLLLLAAGRKNCLGRKRFIFLLTQTELLWEHHSCYSSRVTWFSCN